MSVFGAGGTKKKIIDVTQAQSTKAPTGYLSSQATGNAWDIKRVDIDSVCQPGGECTHKAVLHLKNGALVASPLTKGADLRALLALIGATLKEDGQKHLSHATGSPAGASIVSALNSTFVRIALQKTKKPKKAKKPGAAPVDRPKGKVAKRAKVKEAREK
jgi:hypothetical protein